MVGLNEIPLGTDVINGAEKHVPQHAFSDYQV